MNREATKKNISKQELGEFLARHSRNQTIEQEQTEITENPLFPPFPPVQLSSRRGPGTRSVTPKSSEKRLEQEITEATENLSFVVAVSSC